MSPLAIPHVFTCSFDTQLVVLSYAISWLGAYTSTQIVIHAKYTRSKWAKWFWTLLASLAFGFCAIWSMHFVGMLACRMDIAIGFDPSLTALSAIVAVAFTFAALSSAYVTDAIEKSHFARTVVIAVRTLRRWMFSCCPKWDIEAGYEQLSSEEDERPPRTSQDVLSQQLNEDADMDLYSDDPLDFAMQHDGGSSAFYEPETAPPHAPIFFEPPFRAGAAPDVVQRELIAQRGRPRGPTAMTRASTHPVARSTTLQSPTLVRQRSLPRPTGASQDSSSTSSTLSSELSSDSTSHHRPRANSGTGSALSGTATLQSNASGATSGSSGSSGSWGDVHVGLSREARMRIKARARDRPAPVFGWKYWIGVQWRTITALLVARAAVWGLALVMMHYCGMWAMIIPGGRISWHMGIVALSYVVAFAVCLIACTTMEHMEVHFARQVAFSTIAALGVCSMHYTGMAAATFYTYNPPAPPGQAGYPSYLPMTIVGVAVSVCVVSNLILAHNAIIARNKMAEMILTKRRLWRIMAEKEAAEQATELKQQFISVASHEIRTPLHTVNGYCELMARTPLDEEQELYVSSIQQACHALNVIAGNVLDFSKLDRNNAELSAKPVLMKLRKVVEDAARIQPNQPNVEIVVSVADDVPDTVFLDDTYTFRVLMNLLSNAQKFCEKGYICVVVRLRKPGQVVFQVRDTGVGIPASFRGALFQPFRQADQSLTRQKQGTGLGLSIVKHLVSRMNGSVDVESVEGEGSTFSVRLPIGLPGQDQGTTEEPLLDIVSEPPQASSRKRIRVVHSDKRVEALFVKLFADHGYASVYGLQEASVQEIVRNADAVWADIESISSSALLRALLCAQTSRPFPVYVLHTDSHDMSVLEPELSAAENAVFLKRPLILHSLREVLEAPEAHMGGHLQKEAPKVRFAIPVDAEAVTALRKEKFVERSPGSEKAEEGLEVIEMEPKRKDVVLLVEDNMVNQRLGCRLLEKLGYEVVAVNDGQQAVDAVKQQAFHSCLMDCQMPVMDGFSACRRIRDMEREGAISGHLPVIALTANVTSESEQRCREAGMDHFLPKPLVMADLDAVLKAQGRTSPYRSTL
ncbi:uncharacterized protein B0H18DRAFT_1006430 [Fomitopsis serialis]|uniref:uncharacterized protein n=1 Tax=Fomitopsis serialis TaxID=139415 RepID=UPI0020086A39|nr:uncharacterized protein B0H18DRAFT_1006430 [Neoantrodia serialis]KAH9926496.1 hypothetical protein B0H18DRAFT_1006430 [Neoantrodia serialis]